jgi:hypothetical protein
MSVAGETQTTAVGMRGTPQLLLLLVVVLVAAAWCASLVRKSANSLASTAAVTVGVAAA